MRNFERESELTSIHRFRVDNKPLIEEVSNIISPIDVFSISIFNLMPTSAAWNGWRKCSWIWSKDFYLEILFKSTVWNIFPLFFCLSIVSAYLKLWWGILKDSTVSTVCARRLIRRCSRAKINRNIIYIHNV